MKFNVNQQDLQQALNYCQGVIEKRSTLQILSNILLEVKNSKLTITATDLDIMLKSLRKVKQLLHLQLCMILSENSPQEKKLI